MTLDLPSRIVLAMLRKIRDERDARACLRALTIAGMGVGEWSRANGVDGRSLVAWRTNLAHRAAAVHVSKAGLIELAPATSPRPEGRYVVPDLRTRVGTRVEVPFETEPHQLTVNPTRGQPLRPRTDLFRAEPSAPDRDEPVDP